MKSDIEKSPCGIGIRNKLWYSMDIFDRLPMDMTCKNSQYVGSIKKLLIKIHGRPGVSCFGPAGPSFNDIVPVCFRTPVGVAAPIGYRPARGIHRNVNH